MFEDYEGVSDSNGLEQFSDSKSIDERNFLSSTESNYIEEVLPYKDSDLLAARIDEMGASMPPKSITDYCISGIENMFRPSEFLIEPMKDDINPLYLEAPSDSVQISESVEAMESIDGLSFDDWKDSTFDQKVNSLQALENSIAEIAHRPPCQINVENLGEGNYGFFDPNTKDITVNSMYIDSNGFNDYKETLDTIVHEGRHAYQDYNMTEREVHPRGSEVENWRLNNDSQLGYLNAQRWGFELYQYQPMEADARAFAGDVLNQYLKNA